MKSNKIKRYLKKFVKFFFDDMLLESMILNIVLVCIIFCSNSWKIYSLIFSALYIGIKIARHRFIDTIFNLNLIKSRSDNSIYLLFVFINLTMLVECFIISSTYDRTLFFIVLAMRVILAIENKYIQYRILDSAISDLYTWGQVEENNLLSDGKTKKRLSQLASIKKSLIESTEKNMKNEMLKAELITNITHDLKTPLTSMINYTEILQRKETLDVEAKEYIRVLGHNADRLKTLITDLIYAQKTGSRDIEKREILIDFEELLMQIYADYQEMFKSRGLEFEYNSLDEEVLLYTDPELLVRILENLISNAYKYSVENSTIEASILVEYDDVIFRLKNEMAEPINADTDLLGELVKSEKSRSSDGSGLGLYITKNLAEILRSEFKIETVDNYFIAILKLKRD